MIKLTASWHDSGERRRAGASPLWRALRQVAHVIREFHTDQVYFWERYYLASRALAPRDGPLAWVPTLDGYRLAGNHLPAPAEEANRARRAG